jgi:hypothetical protein
MAAPQAQMATEQDKRAKDRSRSPRRESDEKVMHDRLNGESTDLLDGHSAEAIFNGSSKTGYTYDDLICMPGYIKL